MYHIPPTSHGSPTAALGIGFKVACLSLASLLSLSTPAFALSLAGWEPNTGQWPASSMYRTTTSSGASSINAQGQLIHNIVPADALVTEVFVGARAPAWQGFEVQATKAGYFRGNNPTRWRTGLPRFGALHMKDAYPGIDVLLQLNGSELERLFELAPNADPSQIQLSLQGAESANIHADGSLQLSFRGTQTNFEYSAPVAWQNTEQGKSAVQIRWHKLGPDRFGFDLGEYDKQLPLTIDPVSRATYFGGGAAETTSGALVHSNGDVYLSASSESEDLSGAGGNKEVAIARFSADLTTLKQVIFYGGGGDDTVQNLIELANGDLLVVGNTESDDLPGVNGGAQSLFGGRGSMLPDVGEPQGDGFVLRLPADLSGIGQATYLGGSAVDAILRIAVDGEDLYVLGSTASLDFPEVDGGAQTIIANPFPTPQNLFLTRMPLTLTSIVQSTYYGGNNLELGFSLLVNSDGVYIAGTTGSTDLIGTASGAQPQISTDGVFALDTFVARFNKALSAVTNATYFGGTGVEQIGSITDLGGSLYLSGITQSEDLPRVLGGAQSTNGGGPLADLRVDAFVALLSADLTSISQATYFGGSGQEGAILNVRSNGGNIYISGATNSTDLPGTSGAAQSTYGGGGNVGDGFVASISPDLTTLARATYIGGSDDDLGFAFFTDDGTLFFSGLTNSPDMPAVAGGLQATFGGAGTDNLGDVYLARLSADLTTILQASYYGGGGDENGTLIPGTTGEIAYIAGSTTSVDLPVTAGGAQSAHANPSTEDLFIALIDGSLTASGDSTNPDPDPSGPIVSAALPGQRVFTLGGPGVTFFGTVINAGSTPAVDCSLALGSAIPATFSYQTTGPSNELVGTQNTPVDIAAGAAQSFLFSITPTATFASTNITPVYDCANTDPAPVSPGVNTIQVLSTDVPTPDVVAIVLSATNDGIAHIPGTQGSVAVAMATVNVGASGDVTLSADTGALDHGVVINLCQTDPANGTCINPPSAMVTLTIARDATPTFSAFITGTQNVASDPANNRVNLRFMQGSTQVGQSSLALQTD